MRETTVLSLSYGRIVVKPPEKLHGLVPASFETYQIVEPGDIIIRSTDLQNDWNSLRVGLVGNRGIITSAYLCFRAFRGVSPEYGYQLLHAFDLMKVLYGMGSGLRQNLDFRDFKRMTILIPSPAEQTAIVRFLTWANAQLGLAIQEKRRLIDLLNEQKRAIIDDAVTRGLDPTATFKPSGIPWLGDIPEHWTVSRLKFEATHIVDCLHATPHYSADGEYPAIRTADIEPGKVRLSRIRKVSAAEYARWTSRLRPTEGDILYSREGERYGIAALVPPGLQLCISQRMMVFRIRPTQCSEFIMWQLNCPHVYSQAAADIIGATAPHVNVERIRNYRIALPPVAEQRAISEHIRTSCAGLDAAVTRLEREIELLREYRTRLTADVVTGKLDARHVDVPLGEIGSDVKPLTDSEEIETDEDNMVEEYADADN